tara:strand:+ start:1810 stop:2943 length:1134 start_codon:yes stop_codon:yes gene_type:complete
MADGLIWSGIGQGIANAGSSIGSMMMRDYERQNDRDWREKQAQEQRDFREEQNAMYRRTADQQMAGRGGAGGNAAGLNPEDLAPGGKLAGMMAGNAGMNEVEYAKYIAARKSGDMSPFMQEETEYGSFGEENKVSKLPTGFEKEYAAKMKTISKLEEQYALGTRYDDVAKGRQTEFATGVGQGVLSGAIPMGKGSGAVASSEGKQILNTEGGETYNMYTGESKTTPMGKSQITENLAKAGEATKKGDAAETKAERQEKAKGQTTLDLERQVKNAKDILHEGLGVSPTQANEELKNLRARAATDAKAKARLDALAPAIADLDTARAKLKAWEAKASAPDSGAPPAPTGGMPEPKSAGEVAKLKPGTRFKAPDGSIRIR